MRATYRCLHPHNVSKPSSNIFWIMWVENMHIGNRNDVSKNKTDAGIMYKLKFLSAGFREVEVIELVKIKMRNNWCKDKLFLREINHFIRIK